MLHLQHLQDITFLIISQGSLLSCLVASVVVLWMVVGGELYDVQDNPLSVPLSMCFNTNPDNETSVSTILPHVSFQTKSKLIPFLNTTENPLNNDIINGDNKR